MKNLHKTLSFTCALLFAFSPVASALAQEETTPTSSISFEEILGSNGQRGKLTLLLPTQASFSVPTPPYRLTTIVPGSYTLFVAPPPGTSTKIILLDGNIELKSIDTTQLSFDATVTSNFTVKIIYTLTDYGDVGVTSEPPGVPFTLQGPAKMEYTGITPQTLEKVPIGSYGILYKPKGCTAPPGQGEELKRNTKVYFTISLNCDTFVPTRNPAMKSTDTAVFYDVTADAWYAPFVSRVSKLGIMSGYKDQNGNALGHFGPADEITLAQLAKITHVLVGLDEKDFNGTPDNVSARGTWYEQIALSAERRDWKLFTDRAADLNRPATRGEVLITFLQALDIPLSWPTGNVFKDVARRTPYASAIETAAKLGYVQGKTQSDGSLSGMFGPLEHINRAEMAKLVSVFADHGAGSSEKSSAPAARGR